MKPNTLEYRQAILGAQGGSQPDPWMVRIQWIVDTFEDGDTATARIAAAAETLGMTGEAIRRLYRGTGVPGGDTLARIMTEYPRVNPVWLLTGHGPRERPATDRADGYAEGLARAAQELREIADQLDRRAGKAPGPDEEPGTGEPTGSPPGGGPSASGRDALDRHLKRRQSPGGTGTDG